jgi:ferredoxin/flavodoxin---NADP+ reductase
VTLVHRREAFRAHQATVDKVLASTVEVRTNANVARLVGQQGLEAVEVEDVKTKETVTLPAQAVVAALGFVADLGPIQSWGLEVKKRHIVVDSATRTNLPRVFAAGDITDYPGKVRLIAVGFGEAATAVNNAAVAINPGAHLFPGHSSEG